MIIDTSVLISAVECRTPKTVRWIELLAEQAIRSMITTAELEVGVLTADEETIGVRTRSRDLHLEITQVVVPQVSVSELAERFAQVTAVAKKASIRIGQNDRWLIAEAICCDGPQEIITCDGPMLELTRTLRRPSSMKRLLGNPLELPSAPEG